MKEMETCEGWMLLLLAVAAAVACCLLLAGCWVLVPLLVVSVLLRRVCRSRWPMGETWRFILVPP